jgi:ketosteroid isomerase-like protein
MPRTLKALIEENTTRQVFQGAVSAWAGRDLDGLMHYIGDEIANVINVDPSVVPFAPSVVGKAAYRDKLQHILNSFEFASYVTNHLAVDGDTARANMKIIWYHIATGERLQTSFRFLVEQRGGRITRINQFYDAAYLETFARLISTPPPHKTSKDFWYPDPALRLR